MEIDLEGLSKSTMTYQADQENCPYKKTWMDPELQEMSVVNTVSGTWPDAGSFSIS